MFYDSATARLYYTEAGSSRLPYRYVSPATETVGAVGYSAASRVPGLDWRQVASMLLTGYQLFVAPPAAANVTVPLSGPVLSISSPRHRRVPELTGNSFRPST